MFVRSFKKYEISLNLDRNYKDQVNIKRIENYEFPIADKIAEFSLDSDDYSDFTDDYDS